MNNISCQPKVFRNPLRIEKFYVSLQGIINSINEPYMNLSMMKKIEEKKISTVEETLKVTVTSENEDVNSMDAVAPKAVGRLDMVIAFDTTGSMAAYIDSVRKEVAELIPRLFKDNEDLRLGIVAFGDYCDMTDAQNFGDAYQCIAPTDNANDLIRFVNESRNTSGGDWEEFYELVIRKIVNETNWREDATRSILLIADAVPHEKGYSYRDIVSNSMIDWRDEARNAAYNKIKIDTVTITDEPWYQELSKLTNGVSVPFKSGSKTAMLVEAAVSSRGTMKSRHRFDEMMSECDDPEMSAVFESYKSVRNDIS